MKYFLYFSTDLEKLVEGFCLFFLNKNQKKQFLEPTYNVYADDSVNQGFITDLFDIIGTTQDYNFFIKRVLH